MKRLQKSVLPVLATLLVASLVTVGAPSSAAVAEDARPNIILITTDDMRADELWGMDNVRELLISQGTTFGRAYVPFPLCCPSRATMLTGQYAHNHGVLGNGKNDEVGGERDFDDSSTLATWLQDAGYSTGYIGKYLNGYGNDEPPAVPPGWTEWHGAFDGGAYYTTRLLEDGVENEYKGIYQTDLGGDIATDMVTRQAAGDAPFFLFTSFFAPHYGQPAEPDDPARIKTPAVADRHRDAFADVALPDIPSFNEADVSDKPAAIRDNALLTRTMVEGITEHYQQRLEALLAVDEAIGKMMAALTASGELDNTIVVFTSDNGYLLGEHRIPQGKTVPYEPSARVPLIVRGPGFPAGVERTQTVALIDLAPTFVEIAGATAGLVMDGVSLSPVAQSPTYGRGRIIVVEAGPKVADAPWFYRGLRSERYLYVEYEETGEVELYDMRKDPYQLVNLAFEPIPYVERRILPQLSSLLAEMHDCAGSDCQG